MCIRSSFSKEVSRILSRSKALQFECEQSESLGMRAAISRLIFINIKALSISYIKRTLTYSYTKVIHREMHIRINIVKHNTLHI